jgi:DNA-binding response OmpR family regulator
LVDVLEAEGYQVIAVKNGDDAIAQFSRNTTQLVLRDVMMPKSSGYDVCRAIRQVDPRVPIIMHTAKSEEIDKVLGLELGAHDYVTKPFGVRELLARFAAALRRSQLLQTETGGLPDIFPFGAAQIDAKRFHATLDGKTHSLTERELTLILLFPAKSGEVLTRDYLLDSAWGIRYRGTTRTLDQHIVQLRKKIERSPSDPETIITVHGIGYRHGV